MHIRPLPIALLLVLTFAAPTLATGPDLPEAYFLVNPAFADGMDAWESDRLEDQGGNEFFTDTQGGHLILSGAPGAGDFEQQTTADILTGTRMVIPHSTSQCSSTTLEVMLVPFLPERTAGDHGWSVPEDSVERIATTAGQCVIGWTDFEWTATHVVPAGTWFVFHAAVWPGDAEHIIGGIFSDPIEYASIPPGPVTNLTAPMPSHQGGRLNASVGIFPASVDGTSVSVPEDHIRLTWERPARNDGPPVARYSIHRYATGNCNDLTLACAQTTTFTNATMFEEVSPGAGHYRYLVEACNAYGCSAPREADVAALF